MSYATLTLQIDTEIATITLNRLDMPEETLEQ
jgi:hypothetical protein